MKKSEKIVKIIQYINNHPSFTLRELAEEFSFSIRTAQRYIEDMERIGVPLYVEYGPKGGYRLIDNKRILPPLLFTETEAYAVFFACQMIDSYHELPFAEELIQIKSKFLSSLSEASQVEIIQMEQVLYFWVPRRETQVPLLRQLFSATLKHLRLEIEYSSLKQISRKMILPLGIYALNGIWYCAAHDIVLEKTIELRVDRIVGIMSEKKQEDFLTEGKAFNVKDYVASIFIIDGSLKLEVNLTERGYLLCESEPFFYNKMVKQQGGTNKILMAIEPEHIEWLAQYFIGIGIDAEVLKPIELREEIAERIAILQQRYSSN